MRESRQVRNHEPRDFRGHTTFHALHNHADAPRSPPQKLPPLLDRTVYPRMLESLSSRNNVEVLCGKVGQEVIASYVSATAMIRASRGNRFAIKPLWIAGTVPGFVMMVNTRNEMSQKGHGL